MIYITKMGTKEPKYIKIQVGKCDSCFFCFCLVFFCYEAKTYLVPSNVAVGSIQLAPKCNNQSKCFMNKI